MSFYPDLNKQAQEMIFSRKLNISYISPKIFFNNTPVVYANWQKPLGMFSDESLQNWKNSIQEFKNSILLQVQVSSKEHQRSLSYNKLGLESLKFRCWFRKLWSWTDVYMYSFFPYTTLEWNKLDKKTAI